METRQRGRIGHGLVSAATAILLRREWLLVLLALGLAATAAAVVYLSRPTTLTVAVGPQDGPEARVDGRLRQRPVPRAARTCG